MGSEIIKKSHMTGRQRDNKTGIQNLRREIGGLDGNSGRYLTILKSIT